MKKTLILSVAVLFFSFLFTQGVLAARKPMAVRVGKGTVKVNYLDGSAQVRSTADAPWKEIKVGHILRGGDEVEVAKGVDWNCFCPIIRPFGLRGSLFKINAAPDEESRDVDVHLTVGKSWAKVQAAAGIKRKFGISTENAVAGVRGTVYRVNAEEDKSVLVRVYEGEVEVTGKAPAPADRVEQIFGKNRSPSRVPNRWRDRSPFPWKNGPCCSKPCSRSSSARTARRRNPGPLPWRKIGMIGWTGTVRGTKI